MAEFHRYRMALVIRQPQADTMTLLVTPCSPPPTAHVAPTSDVPLWEIPFVELPSSSAPNASSNNSSLSCSVASTAYGALCDVGITDLDVFTAVFQLKSQLAPVWDVMQSWKYWKVVEEPHYGPDFGFWTVFFITELNLTGNLPIAGQWLNSKNAWELLTKGDVERMRIGSLAAYSFSPHFPQGLKYKFNLNIKSQEYPPGVLLVPLDSSTRKPFSKTNLIVFASSVVNINDPNNMLAGDALIVDPACHPIEAQEQLSTIVKALPRKLLVFLTHHHFDHVEGLPTVQKQNPDALILAHERTLQRIRKGKLKCIPVSDESMLQIGDQQLQVISAPGHTDGHLALMHVKTRTLIAGDHCVGKGSSILDMRSGGNMKDYLMTTRKFIDLSPNMIIPMHGPFNLWPRHMMWTYLRHREVREEKILDSIKNGALTAYDIVSKVYSDTPYELWPAALSNVILHVEHLNYLKKLPEGFSYTSFKRSCKLRFMFLWLTLMTKKTVLEKCMQPDYAWLVPLAAGIGSAWFLWQRRGAS